MFGASLFYMPLFYSYGNVLGDAEAVPLVIDHEDGAADGVALLVAKFAEQVAVEPPLEGHGILGKDQVFVGIVVGEPLAVDENLGTRDIKDDAMIIVLAERSVISSADSRGHGGHKVFDKETSRVHQDQWLTLWLIIDNVVCVTVSIQVKPDIVSKISRVSNHFQEFIYIFNFGKHLET